MGGFCGGREGGRTGCGCEDDEAGPVVFDQFAHVGDGLLVLELGLSHRIGHCLCIELVGFDGILLVRHFGSRCSQ